MRSERIEFEGGMLSKSRNEHLRFFIKTKFESITKLPKCSHLDAKKL